MLLEEHAKYCWGLYDDDDYDDDDDDHHNDNDDYDDCVDCDGDECGYE